MPCYNHNCVDWNSLLLQITYLAIVLFNCLHSCTIQSNSINIYKAIATLYLTKGVLFHFIFMLSSF